MSGLAEILNFKNPVFQSYVFWATVLGLKMLAMSFLTAIQRFRNKAFANPEDSASFKGLKPKFGVEDVERVRRAHRNDMENIFVFISVAFFYLLTSPSTFVAVNLFRAAAIARIAHTVFYAIMPMQPARGISWGVCYATTIYMGVQVLLFFY